MIRLLKRKRFGPIGVDVGSRSIKLVQLSAVRDVVWETSRWEWAGDGDSADPAWCDQLTEALRHALEGRSFHGRNAVLCLSDRHMFLQNVRVPKLEGDEMDHAVQQEIASRIPYPVEETDLRYWEAADIRQGEQLLREVIVFACHRPFLIRMVTAFQRAGLRPVAVDIEPAALLRSYCAQFRRDEERSQRTLIVHIGYATTGVVIAQGDEALFVKYIDLGGRQLDECISKALDMDASQANSLRRAQEHSGDCEVARSLWEAMRPVAEKLVREVAMCVRYHSVTFRGRPLERILVGGGEASSHLVELFGQRLGMQVEASDPFRRIESGRGHGRPGQWDVAAGLALRDSSEASRQ